MGKSYVKSECLLNYPNPILSSDYWIPQNSLLNKFQNPVKSRNSIIVGVPNNNSISNNMIFGNEPPKTAILTIISIVTHSKIIVRFNHIFIRFNTVDKDFTITIFEGITLVSLNKIFVNKPILVVKLNFLPFKRNHKWSHVILVFK